MHDFHHTAGHRRWGWSGTFSHLENAYDAKLLWLTGYPDRDTGLGMVNGSQTHYLGTGAGAPA